MQDAKTALKKHFLPTYQSIIAWAETQKDRAPAIVTGVGSQPNGAAYYKHRLATQTTTSLTADEIHQIGLDEIARLRKEMQSIMDEVKFEGDLSEFFEHVHGTENGITTPTLTRDVRPTLLMPPRLLKISNRNFQSFSG